MSFFNPTPFRQTYISRSIVDSLREHHTSHSSDSNEENEQEEGEEIDQDIDEEAVSFSGEPQDEYNYEDEGPVHPIGSREEHYEEEEEKEEEEEEDDFSLEGEEEQELIDMEILADETRKEEDRFSVLSTESNILFNPQIEKERRDGNPAWTVYSSSTWQLLESLALPTYPALLALYVRHCVYVSSSWLRSILEELKESGAVSFKRHPRLESIPHNFKTEILPKIQSILYKVQHRRWLCCISKKYQGGICTAIQCPQFRYVDNEIEDNGEEEDKYDHSNAGFCYSMDFRRPKPSGGDPYREVKKEVNMSATLSSNSQKLVPILWALEFRLLALIYIHNEWITENRTAHDFPQLNDSRTLYSVHNPSLCEKSIMQYNVEELRDALGRLHWRWNDMRPSDDLISYFKLLKDRCALLSVCAKIEVINVNTAVNASVKSKGMHTNNPVRDTSYGVTGTNTTATTAVIPRNIDTKTAFSHFIGSNQQTTVLSLCSDLLFSSSSSTNHTDSSLENSDNVEDARASSKSKKMSAYMEKRRRVNRKINREIQSLGSGFSSLHDRSTRNRTDTRGVIPTDGNKHIHGDPEAQPRMVRVNLNRGPDILEYSSSDEDDGEEEEEEENAEEGNRMARKGKNNSVVRLLSRTKKRKRKMSGQGEEDNYFENKAKMDSNMYRDFGKRFTDTDIGNEILTRSVLSSVRKMCLTERKYSDVEDYLTKTFLPCLTTSTHLNKLASKKNTKTFSATCVTRTNLSFLVETHAVMCEMDEEIRAWETLMFLDSQRDTSTSSHDKTPWISEELQSPFCVPSYIKNDINEKIAYEKGKIESALSWGYDYCNGKRNQFMSRNIRELFFSQYLLPGETEILMNVNRLKNSSIVPSIVVSHLRDDVQRLDKLIYDFTLYHTIEEFAKENGCSVHGGEEGSVKNGCFVKLGKHIFDNNMSKKESPSGPTQDFVRPNAPSTMQRFFNTLHFATDCTAREMLTIHTNAMSVVERNSPNSGEENRDDSSSSSSFSSSHESDKSLVIFHPTYEYLEHLSAYDPNVSFINPNVSIAWKSPRGIAQVVRVVLLQCIEFFMKTVHHSLEAKRFFFTKHMTTQLINDPVFMQAVDKREMTNVLSRLREEEEEENSNQDDGLSRPEEEEEEEFHVPDRSDVFDLLHSSSSSSPPHPPITQEGPSSVPRESVPERRETYVPERSLLSHYSLERPTSTHMKIYASFRFYMQTRFEIICQKFYHRFPIVLYCMTSSFVFFPEKCVTMECKGADELLGYYSWLSASMKYISQHLMPHMFAHFNLTIRSDTQIIQDMVPIMNRSYLEDVERLKEMEQHQHTQWSTYKSSPYPDGGIHYKFLLMLIDKIPSFGQDNNYCKICSFICKVVVQLCYLLYPDLLEKNHIHIPPPCSEHQPIRTPEPSSQELLDSVQQYEGNTTHLGEEHTTNEKIEGEDEDEEEEKSIFVFRASASDM